MFPIVGEEDFLKQQGGTRCDPAHTRLNYSVGGNRQGVFGEVCLGKTPTRIIATRATARRSTGSQAAGAPGASAPPEEANRKAGLWRLARRPSLIPITERRRAIRPDQPIAWRSVSSPGRLPGLVPINAPPGSEIVPLLRRRAGHGNNRTVLARAATAAYWGPAGPLRPAGLHNQDPEQTFFNWLERSPA
jgi:hypothetical protein